jgi:hypothetical protein
VKTALGGRKAWCHRASKRGYTIQCNPLNLQAGLTRLELATSDVTGRAWPITGFSLFNVFHTLEGGGPGLATPKYASFYPKTVLGSSLKLGNRRPTGYQSKPKRNSPQPTTKISNSFGPFLRRVLALVSPRRQQFPDNFRTISSS